MRFELELIRKKALFAKDSAVYHCNEHEEVTACLVDIIKLSNVCLKVMEDIDSNITRLAQNTRRVSSGIS